MSHSLKCQVCGKSATVHLTQIVNNKIHKVDLCEECAQAKGVTDPSGFGFAELFGKPAAADAGEPLVCDQCGFTHANLKKTGRLGCPSCWTKFREVLQPMLEGMHRGLVHKGRTPARLLERKAVHDRLVRLQDDLTEAIKSERFEDAARYRDEIRDLQARHTDAS